MCKVFLGDFAFVCRGLGELRWGWGLDRILGWVEFSGRLCLHEDPDLQVREIGGTHVCGDSRDRGHPPLPVRGGAKESGRFAIPHPAAQRTRVEDGCRLDVFEEALLDAWEQGVVGGVP